MANSDVISAVSATLEARLTAGLDSLGTPAPTAQLHDLVTAVPSEPPVVTLFLYEIAEDPSVQNRRETSRVVGGDLKILKQPLGLILRYMITAWGGDRHAEQRMLGRAMQVLYDDAVLDGFELTGVLAGSTDQLYITLAPLQLEDRARVWSAIGKTYRLSVNYEIRVVEVDAATETSTTPVKQRELATGVSA
jgi:hypothetical protein